MLFNITNLKSTTDHLHPDFLLHLFLLFTVPVVAKVLGIPDTYFHIRIK
jgi:hypothetical protein